MAHKSLNQLLSDWRNARTKMEVLVKNMPRIMGTEGVKVVKDNFKLQGYDSGSGIRKWPERSPDTNKRYDKRKGVKGSVYQSSNPLLKQTRNLYNSVQYWARSKSVTVGSDLSLVPYAKKMNEGGSGTWNGNPTKTPARQFLPKPSEGPNKKVLKFILKKLTFERDNALKDFKK